MLSENLRKLRKKTGFTQIQLSEQLGVSIATLRRLEAGETAPSGVRIIELAKILDVQPDEIVSGGSEGSQGSKPDVQVKSVAVNNGMLIFEKGDIRIELPPTEQGFELFNRLVENLM